jgi:phosphotransferase system HPr-like phosphotransfer protein
MLVRVVTIARLGGLDDTVAQGICRIAQAYQSDLELHVRGIQQVVTSDPTTVTDLHVKQGDRVTIVVRGVDEQYAVKAIERILKQRLSLKVFIASTLQDLVDFRSAAADAIQSIGHEPELVGSLTGASPQQVAEICRAKVKGCDACVVIVGVRRGSGPGDAGGHWSGESFTEIETRAVAGLGIPAFVYFIDRDAFINATVEDNYSDYSRRLRWVEEFRKTLGEKMIARWHIKDTKRLKFLVLLDIDAMSRGIVRPSMPRPPHWDRPPATPPPLPDPAGLGARQKSVRPPASPADFEAAAVPAPVPWSDAYRRALKAHSLGRLDEALKSIDDAVSQGGAESVDVLHSRGVILFAVGRTHDAIAAWEYALSIDPSHVEAQFGIGSALNDLGLYDEAIRVLRDLTSQSQRYFKAWNSLGYAYRQTGHLAEARNCYLRALDCNPGSRVALDGLALLPE